MSFNHPMNNVEGLWIPNPDNQHTLISNPSAEASQYKSEQTNPDQIADPLVCCLGSCEKYPQTVCMECNGYVCEDHIFRHPDCSEGR